MCLALSALSLRFVLWDSLDVLWALEGGSSPLHVVSLLRQQTESSDSSEIYEEFYSETQEYIYDNSSTGTEHFSYTYGPDDRLLRADSNYGNTVLYTYDDTGRLTAIVPEDYQRLLGYAPTPVTTFSYDEAGRLCAEKFFWFLELDGQGGYVPYEGSESVESYYRYDAQGRPVRQKDREDGARDVIEYTYGDYLLFGAEGLDLE